MIGQLEVVHGPDKGRIFPVAEGETVQIGRGPATVTKLCDPFVSRLHCQVEAHDGRLLLSCLGGAGGTLVNGLPVRQYELKANDLIAIGDTQFRVHVAGVHEDHTVMRPAPSTEKAASREMKRLPSDVSLLSGAEMDQYQVGTLLARGRSGLVYQAHDTRNNQPVALKVLLPEFTGNEEDLQRFNRAMRTVLPLRHPNLLSVLDFGQTGAFWWVAMELVEGDSLAQVIQRIGTAGILDWRHALRVAVHVARALAFAHGQGILHRNITPPNILVRSADRLTKLGDLMLAKALEGRKEEQITQSGGLVGELAYMAPERTYEGGRVDGRSDLYGLGATVYALLTGRPPCVGKSALDTIQLIRAAVPARPRTVQLSVPEPFENAVLRLLAKRPEDRFQTAGELQAVLEKIAKEHSLQVA
jgi:serine/threonine protein kinase